MSLGTLETRGDRSVLRYERHLDHPIDRVWRAITDPGEIVRWLAAAEIELTEGGRVRLEWLNTGEEEVVATGTITEIDPPRLVVYDTDAHGVLRWELHDEGDSTRLNLTVDVVLPEDNVSENRSGWHVHLDFLEDALEGGAVDWPNWPRDRWAAIHERYVS